LDAASFVLLSSVDQIDAPATLTALLEEGVHRGLPMVCSNPDTKSVVPDADPVPGPGAAALTYRALGGSVRFIGKPYPEIFAASQRRSAVADPARVLMVGDSLMHDIAGGQAIGCATLLVLSGVHSAAVACEGDAIDMAALERLCRETETSPDY